MRLRSLLVPVIAVLALAVPASANAAYTITGPAAGSATTETKPTITWAGACDAGYTCNHSFTIELSTSPTLDATGQLLESSDYKSYRSLSPDSPDVLAYAATYALRTTTWYAQAQWRRCDADYNCVDQLSPVTSFSVTPYVASPVLKLDTAYHYIRNLSFSYRFTGNAETYALKHTISARRKVGRRVVWKVLYTKRDTRFTSQPGSATSYFDWYVKKAARRGERLQVTTVISTTGMKPVVRTIYVKSV